MVHMNLFAGRDRDTDVENGLDTVQAGDGGTNWKSGIDIYTPLCVK